MADTKYKNKSKTDEGNTVYEYTDKQVQHRNREKAKRVEKLSQNIDKLRKQVKKDLDADDAKKRLKALAVLLMDETYERVGNESSAKEGHYGVTGWKKKHISFSNGKATLKYTGKSGVEQKKTVEDKKAIELLKDLAQDKGDNDELLACQGDDGDECVRASDVNDYLKSFDITAKDIRGFHANREMQEALKKQRKKGPKLPDDKDKREEVLKDEFKKALEEVAKAVGHEDATLKDNYLVPALEAKFMEDGTVIDKLDRKKNSRAKTAEIARKVVGQYVTLYLKTAAYDFEDWLLENGRQVDQGVYALRKSLNYSSVSQKARACGGQIVETASNGVFTVRVGNRIYRLEGPYNGPRVVDLLRTG